MPEVFLPDAKFAPLDAGATTYIFASVKEARPIIDNLPIEELNDKQVIQMLNRTGYLAVAFFPPESGRRFQLVTWGNYPSNANMAFASNKDWSRQRSATGQTYWHSAVNNLSIAMNSKQAFIVASANAQPIDPFTAPPGIEIPEGFNEFRQGSQGLSNAILSCWLEGSGSSITQMLNKAGVPIRVPVQRVFISAFPSDSRYQAIIRLQFENASQARGIATLLSLASGFGSNDETVRLLLGHPPVQNGRNLDIKTAAFGEKELSLLLEMFLLY